jgi:mannosyl-3-phosphoglycerate phosphatase
MDRPCLCIVWTMLVIFTDLDGTLLDSESYSYEKARPGLELLRELEVPLVLCTSKTRAEIEYWRVRLNNHHPFIVENGGALYVPREYFRAPIHAPAYRGGYAVFEFGTSYPDLVATLRSASAETGCQVLGFHQLSAEEVSVRYRMTLAQARLAKEREYDEPFEILGSNPEALMAAIEAKNKRCLRGGRLFHIVGANDKSHGVNLLTHFFQRVFSDVSTVGLGDGPNDLQFLNSVDTPILLDSPSAERLRRFVKSGWISGAEGPEGWNRAVLSILDDSKLGKRSQVWLSSLQRQSRETCRPLLVEEARL